MIEKKEEVREGERREARLRQKHSWNYRQEWTQFDQLWELLFYFCNDPH